MTDAMALLERMDDHDVADSYRRLGLDRLADTELVAAASACMERPKVAPADSFVLHAPLELLARARLLDIVPEADREPARVALARLAATYRKAGPELPEPTAVVGDVDELGDDLARAATAGELDDVDRLAVALARIASPSELRRAIGPWAVASLAAAAHASIALNLLGGPGLVGAVGAAALRGPLRELARHPDWRLRWFEDPTDPAPLPVVLRDALLDVPVLGRPDSSFIYPLMHQAEESGLARRLLRGLAGTPDALPAALVDLQRVAAWSMLQEGPEEAPYGWSHCLTMPQAVLGVAASGAVSAHTAIAVAATHVLGFRAAFGSGALDPGWVPELPRTGRLDDALTAGPEEAAAFVWAEVEAGRGGAVVTALAGQASEHEDAHLVKYTLACIDAAHSDPGAAPLYLSAAASLRGWWAAHDRAH